MRDLHCHILPGVDDGALDLAESKAMLEAAEGAGVTAITCTPHCRRPYFDYDKMWEAFRTLQLASTKIPLQMGFEVNVSMLLKLGMSWAERLSFDGSTEFLLELDDYANEIDFREYRRLIYEVQCKGCDVIIAHPERYLAIQRRPELAYELLRMGCKLQASADFLYGGRQPDPHKTGGVAFTLSSKFSSKSRHVRGCAERLLKEGWYSYIASDAHCAWHYQVFKEAHEKYAEYLRG